MSYYVRKIQNGHWSNGQGQWLRPNEFRDVPADGITIDLKSSDNKLSLWRIDSLDELKDIAISLLTSWDKFHDFYIVAIPSKKINDVSKIENTSNATTAYKKFKTRHYDLVNMNFDKLEKLAKIILECIENAELVFDFIHLNYLEYIRELVVSEEIIYSELKGKIQKEFSN